MHMTKKKHLVSRRTGESNTGVTVTRPASPSIREVGLSMSATSGTGQKQNPVSQVTKPLSNSPVDDAPFVTETRVMFAIALKLFSAGLIEWRKIELNGRFYYAMTFPTDKWSIVGKELLPVRTQDE
jgi:hypothetical protein